jgi:hypothetical protein
MKRTALVVLFAMICCCIAAPVAVLADNSHCTSIEARCAAEAGGRCDVKTGHWCYGISHEGEHCGGSPAAFRACLTRNGVGNVDRPASPATASNPGKCASVQARCIIEAGGYCNPRTGAWRIGNIYQHSYGGNYNTFMACLDRNRVGH